MGRFAVGFVMGVALSWAWADEPSSWLKAIDISGFSLAGGLTPNGEPVRLQMTGDGRVSSFCEALSPLAVQQIVEGVGRR